MAFRGAPLSHIIIISAAQSVRSGTLLHSGDSISMWMKNMLSEETQQLSLFSVGEGRDINNTCCKCVLLWAQCLGNVDRGNEEEQRWYE